MPKMHKDFPDRLFFNCSVELRQKLVALAYLRQAGGMYASVARDLIAEAVAEKVASLNPRQKADYDEILANVKLQDALKAENKKPPV